MRITTHEGIISLDDPVGKELGFTGDNFTLGYLWKIGDAIWISLIMSAAPGNLSKLFKRIHELGFTIKIPSPIGKMRRIVEGKGFTHSVEHPQEIDEDVDVWTLAP